MKNKYLNFIIILIVAAFFIPQIVFATWWNPSSWGIWNSIFHFQKQAHQTQQQSSPTADMKGVSTENVVKEYLVKTQNFDGLDGQVASAKSKIKFSDGFFKDLWEAQLFVEQNTLDFLNYKLKEIDSLKKLNSSSQYIDYLDKKATEIKDQISDIHQKINQVSVKTLQNDSKSAKIQVTYEIDNKNNTGEQKTNQQGVYLLNNINGTWKIIDFTDSEGAWSKTMDYNKMKQDFITSNDQEKKGFDLAASMMKSDIKQNMQIEFLDVGSGGLQTVVWQADFSSGTIWNGNNANTFLLNQSTAVARITTSSEKPDGYLWREINIPEDSYYMSYEFKNENNATESFLTVDLGNEVINYQNLSKAYTDFKKIDEIFVGDFAGKSETLTFELHKVGSQPPSVLIKSMKINKNLPSLPPNY